MPVIVKQSKVCMRCLIEKPMNIHHRICITCRNVNIITTESSNHLYKEFQDDFAYNIFITKHKHIST
jgi:hypothetical protein